MSERPRQDDPGRRLEAVRRERFGPDGGPEVAGFADRSGFFRAAAVAMQRILVDRARSRKAAKRGGGARTVALDDVGGGRGEDPDFLLDVAAALDRLAAEDPDSAEVARHRLFAGLSVKEAAEALGISRASAYREWAYARSWLATALASARSDRTGRSPPPAAA